MSVLKIFAFISIIFVGSMCVDGKPQYENPLEVIGKVADVLPQIQELPLVEHVVPADTYFMWDFYKILKAIGIM
ncbi:hypothetical protein evm_012981 [Chilo suppressalis]|nr:hypothetical protein evm_012981 [Chilo suppressalis]